MSRPADDAKRTARTALRALRRRLRLTQSAILLERLARRFWPMLSWSLFLASLVQLDLLTGVGHSLALGILGAGILIWLLLFVIGASGFVLPSVQEAASRLDRDLPGRPLESLNDTPANKDDDMVVDHLWSHHLTRMAALAKTSRAAKPDLRLSRRDPWAIRLVALFLFASAFSFTPNDPVKSLTDSLGLQNRVVATGPSFEGWAEPPLYTGKPTIYLNGISNGTGLDLPVGTRITVRVYGGVAKTKLNETVSENGATKLPENGTDLTETDFVALKDGEISFTSESGAVFQWDVTIIPDRPPTVNLTEDVTRTVQGKLKMPYSAQDDYGIAGGSVRLALRLSDVDRRYGLAIDPEPRDPVEFDLPMPFNQDASLIKDTIIEDLAEHPWAGLPVEITLSVTDDVGQSGSIDPIITAMPGKRFFDGLAGAIAEQRRDLLWNRLNAPRVALILRAITYQPETIFNSDKAYLMVRTALRRLEYNQSNRLPDDIRDDIADLLWHAALLIEDGDLADARDRLKRAQKRLSDAMNNGATDDEIAQLMEDLRQATKQYMRQLAQEQRKNPDRQQAQDGQSQSITQDQLQKMMDRIQQLMEQGRMVEAETLLKRLQQMMENMRVTEGGSGDKSSQGQRSLEELGDTLRQQQGLADETFRQLQENFNQSRQQGQGKPQQDQQGQGGDKLNPGGQQGQEGRNNSPGQLAQRQRALRNLLEQQRSRLPAEKGDGAAGYRKSLEQAERQMGEAEKKLGQGDTEGALDNQSNALESMREGMRQLNEANREARAGQNNGQGQQGARNNRNRRDPLGRDFSKFGSAESGEKLVPTEEAFRRAREILKEIRRRSGDRTRPALELDYLRRLLDRF